MINRELYLKIKTKLFGGKIIILLGPRQVGKTTLIEKLAKESNVKFLKLNGDLPIVQEMLGEPNIEKFKSLFSTNEIIFIDEAQRINNIGITLKIIHDELKQYQIIASGSSSFDLTEQINEPMTGRKWEFMMYPISWKEWVDHTSTITSFQSLENKLIYGMYPEIVAHPGSEVLLLKELAGSYLYKDLLSYKGIRKPEVLTKLLRALALQLGNEVSYNELANIVQIDRATVENYINLLEKAFVIFRLQPFSNNQRKEIVSSRKIYFYDNGIRNAIIDHFSPISYRQDFGGLWENFLISERLKKNHYNDNFSNSFFWRTTDQKEIDYVEEKNGQIFGYEFKWNPKTKTKAFKYFLERYPNAILKIITPENYFEFLL